jgi:hypothetical protein
MSMRAPLILVLALVLGVACAGLVACGGKGNPHLLSAARADRIDSALSDLQSAVDGQDCAEARQAARRLETQVTSLPSDTDPRLRDRLQEGSDNLRTRAVEECRKTDTTTTETTPTVTETTPTETTPTETTTTETTTTTTPTTTTPTTTTPTTTTPPPTVTTPDSGGSTVPQG